MIQLLKLYLELDHLSMYKQWIYTKKCWFFFWKTMKAYFKVVILSLKIYENILKFNFLLTVVLLFYWLFMQIIWSGHLSMQKTMKSFQIYNHSKNALWAQQLKINRKYNTIKRWFTIKLS